MINIFSESIPMFLIAIFTFFVPKRLQWLRWQSIAIYIHHNCWLIKRFQFNNSAINKVLAKEQQHYPTLPNTTHTLTHTTGKQPLNDSSKAAMVGSRGLHHQYLHRVCITSITVHNNQNPLNITIKFCLSYYLQLKMTKSVGEALDEFGEVRWDCALWDGALPGRSRYRHFHKDQHESQ